MKNDWKNLLVLAGLLVATTAPAFSDEIRKAAHNEAKAEDAEAVAAHDRAKAEVAAEHGHGLKAHREAVKAKEAEHEARHDEKKVEHEEHKAEEYRR